MYVEGEHNTSSSVNFTCIDINWIGEAGCENGSPSQTTSNSSPSLIKTNDEGMELTRINDIAILASKPAEKGVFREITIKTHNKSKKFSWTTTANNTYYPMAYVTDINPR